MPVTLAQAALNAATDLDVTVINEFRRNNLLSLVTFDDVVNPAGGGATLTYGYTRQITTAAAAFRAINSEYTPSEATKQRYTVDLKPLGGSFQIDRVLARVGAAASNDVAFQMAEKIAAAQATFGNAVINGDVAVDANGFDGLSKALVGTATEDTTVYDLSGTHDTTWAFRVLETLDALVGKVDGGANAIIGNTRTINIARAAARITSMYVREPTGLTDANGQPEYLERYGNALLFDAGKKADGTTDVVPFNVADPDGAGPLVANSTQLYAARFAIDGFHGVSTVGELTRQWLPDFSTAGAVKTGEVEMGPVAMVLKKSKAAAVFRNVKLA